MGGLLSCITMEMFCCFGSCMTHLLSNVINTTLSKVVKFSYVSIFLLIYFIAVYIGIYYSSSINDINDFNFSHNKVNVQIGLHCNNEEYFNHCIFQQLIYRASFTLFLFFITLAILSNYCIYIDNNFWLFKFLIVIIIFFILWLIDDKYFITWGEISRIISIGWLFVQALLYLDFAHDVHDIAMKYIDDEDNFNHRMIYILLSLFILVSSITGLIYLLIFYTTNCELNMFFLILTLVIGILTTIFSISSYISRGILTPSLMFAYSIFICWYALLSNPSQTCNPEANYNHNNNNDNDVMNSDHLITTSIIVVCCVSISILLYCVGNGMKIMNIFHHDSEGVLMSYSQLDLSHNNSSTIELRDILTGGSYSNLHTSEDDINNNHSTSYDTSLEYHHNSSNPTNDQVLTLPKERNLFHILMMLASCYAAMILTNWGKTNGEPVIGTGGDASTGNESMWIKIISQWIFLILYCKALHVTYVENNEI